MRETAARAQRATTRFPCRRRRARREPAAGLSFLASSAKSIGPVFLFQGRGAAALTSWQRPSPVGHNPLRLPPASRHAFYSGASLGPAGEAVVLPARPVDRDSGFLRAAVNPSAFSPRLISFFLFAARAASALGARGAETKGPRLAASPLSLGRAPRRRNAGHITRSRRLLRFFFFFIFFSHLFAAVPAHRSSIY